MPVTLWHESLQSTICSLVETDYEHWADVEFYRDSLANIHKEKANSYFYKCFLCFQSIILSPFLHLWPFFFKKEEERERMKGRGGKGGRGCKSRLCVLPAFLHISLFLFYNLTSNPITQGKHNSQRSPVTLNYQIERLYQFLFSCKL